MKIAQVSPLYESVPPLHYGGTERVVSYLTEELVRKGHEVTLFASADSVTSAELVPCAPAALRLGNCVDPLAPHLCMLEEVFRRIEAFDVVHFHIDYLHFPLLRRHRFNHLTTLHGRLDLPDLVPLYREYGDMPLVSISDAQRAPLPFANWVGTVHHGLPADLFRLEEKPGDYLAFLGRIAPEKRPDRAIEIAIKSGIPLKIAAKVDKVDREYFETRIKPLLDSPLIEFIGEIGDNEKQEFLGQARALLFPIDWPEPFGLVMIESIACGTPVIAYRHGSVPEVMDEGLTGYIVNDIDTAVARVLDISDLDRRCCRQGFENRFSIGKMAEAYLALYDRPRPIEWINRSRCTRTAGRRKRLTPNACQGR
ncbi:glycosyltransferase family 4 protein [Geothermobacter hydrogeniphilus]|uniref:Glycosyl transferase n=1 Tax=Geothermobacter hydrogeniphilus TaxID=1969733 RepID=A0A1X0XWY0_9BACT|nr:glycosyltransferase family 4 protein [Geothermobacter hydrogeniphilus]ORJ57397.1 glycosyl transferase [Geothermobacter hydrogeniphilus]